jgi:vacuolar-type H+-ATPase subunit E/Vma4
MIEGWLIAAEEELDEARAPIVSGFFEAFGDKIRGMLTESDVLPALKDMRDGLLERLDG